MAASKHPPIRFEINGYPVELNGSVGFDKSIDYIATLPITPALVGNDAFRFLEGATIDVPIRGTSSDPNFNEAVMQKATESLVQQAMQKGFAKGPPGYFSKNARKKVTTPSAETDSTGELDLTPLPHFFILLPLCDGRVISPCRK